MIQVYALNGYGRVSYLKSSYTACTMDLLYHDHLFPLKTNVVYSCVMLSSLTEKLY